MSFWYPLSWPTIGEEEIDAATAVLRSGRTTMGDQVEAFEEAFARKVGARHAVMVNSGSSADLLMAFASGVPGTVFIPAVTWPTHVWSWGMAEWNVQFVDVDGLNTTAAILRAADIGQQDMLSLVHLMGIPVDLASAGCRVTEDCCEALGSDVGLLGDMASWSFFFSHHMTTMEGGMVTTKSTRLASLLRSLRSHGWARHEGRNPYEFVTVGFNVRPTEVAAVIGRVQLERLDHFNKIRAENRQVFLDALDGCPGIELFPEATFGLPMIAEDRDGLARHLGDNGVETRPILAGNLLRQPAFANFPPQHLPGADRVHYHGLYVGLHPTPDSGVERVAELIGKYLG